MESPGEHLKREREHRGVSLQKIFESTRVPMKYLEAIEADRIEGLPHPAFVKGFIRSYCKVLGLDENDAVLRYEVWLADMNAEAENAGKPQVAPEARPQKAAASTPSVNLHPYLGKLIVAIVGIVIVVAAYSLTRRDLSAPEPGVPAPQSAPATEPLAPPSIEPSTVTPAAQVPMRLPDAVPAEPNAPLSTVWVPRPAEPAAAQPELTPAVPSMTVPAHKSLPAEPAAKPAAPVAQPVQPGQKAAQPVEAAPIKKEAPAPVDGAMKKEEEPAVAHTLTVSAKDTVWLKVGVDSANPVEVLLKKGERTTWKASDKISVIIGNAAGVTVNYNGKDMAVVGGQGEVIGLTLPSGVSYKIKKALPVAPPPPSPADATQSPAINMPEIPAAPQPAPVE